MAEHIPAGQAETLIVVVAHTTRSKIKVFLDAGANYRLGKAQSRAVLGWVS